MPRLFWHSTINDRQIPTEENRVWLEKRLIAKQPKYPDPHPDDPFNNIKYLQQWLRSPDCLSRDSATRFPFTLDCEALLYTASAGKQLVAITAMMDEYQYLSSYGRDIIYQLSSQTLLLRYDRGPFLRTIVGETADTRFGQTIDVTKQQYYALPSLWMWIQWHGNQTTLGGKKANGKPPADITDELTEIMIDIEHVTHQWRYENDR